MARTGKIGHVRWHWLMDHFGSKAETTNALKEFAGCGALAAPSSPLDQRIFHNHYLICEEAVLLRNSGDAFEAINPMVAPALTLPAISSSPHEMTVFGLEIPGDKI